MSIRAFGSRLFRHGQTYVRQLCKRDYTFSNIGEKINAAPNTAVTRPQRFALRNVGVQLTLHARRILIDNVLNRVTNSLAAELRKKTARRILFGDSGPFFAFIGVSLASGTGILTKEEELEGVCWEIREAVCKFNWNVDNSTDIAETTFQSESLSVNDFTFGKPIAKGANAVVYEAALKNDSSQTVTEKTNTLISSKSINDYPLAIKIMFNYDIQSNAMAILQAMYKEIIPVRHFDNISNVTALDAMWTNKGVNLPAHPNVVAIYSAFADQIPELTDAKGLYPAALPRRLYPDGEGRNMSLFLIMKRYNCTLSDYLHNMQPSLRISVLLFAQLLEGITHMSSYGIAHRDLKSDNLLLDNFDEHAPILVISDFGCCLADKNCGLELSYSTYEIDKGGNAALMAPEIITQTPGTFSVLNYSKSDLWAAGTIAYEIFGLCNPFYVCNGNSDKKLVNTTYKEEELPELSEEIPIIIRSLIKNLLKRNPKKRLSPEIAANVLQLYLWAPSNWIKTDRKIPSNAEILQWLLCLTTKVLCEGRLHNQLKDMGIFTVDNSKDGRRTYPEYLLISSFCEGLHWPIFVLL